MDFYKQSLIGEKWDNPPFLVW